MTTKQITPSGAVLVALDIAKSRNEVLVEFPDRQRRRKLSIHNTRDDHDRLIGLLRGGSVHLNSPALLLSGASAGFMPLREAVG